MTTLNDCVDIVESRSLAPRPPGAPGTRGRPLGEPLEPLWLPMGRWRRWGLRLEASPLAWAAWCSTGAVEDGCHCGWEGRVDLCTQKRGRSREGGRSTERP